MARRAWAEDRVARAADTDALGAAVKREIDPRRFPLRPLPKREVLLHLACQQLRLKTIPRIAVVQEDTNIVEPSP